MSLTSPWRSDSAKYYFDLAGSCSSKLNVSKVQEAAEKTLLDLNTSHILKSDPIDPLIQG